MQLAFSLALLLAAVIFVVFVGLILYEIKPFTNFERGAAALIWSLPVSVFLTMILVYLDTPYIFLSLFGVPGLSTLLLPPGKSGVWRILGGTIGSYYFHHAGYEWGDRDVAQFGTSSFSEPRFRILLPKR